MISFEEVYKMADRSSAEVAFNHGECAALYNLLVKLPDGANVVEIGVQFGRSATVIGAVAKEKKFDFIAVDNYKEDVSPEAKANVYSLLLKEFKLPMVLWEMDSHNAAQIYDKDIDLIHIDGDHTYEGVIADILDWAPKVCKGGYICFDDYGHDSLPGVYKAVEESLLKDVKNFKFIGRYGDKLGVFERI